MRFGKLAAAMVATWTVLIGGPQVFGQGRVPPGETSWKADRQIRRGAVVPTESQRQVRPLHESQSTLRADRIASQARPGRVAPTAARMSNGYLPSKFRGAQDNAAAPANQPAAPAMANPEPVPAQAHVPMNEAYYEDGAVGAIGESYFDDCGGCGSCDSCAMACDDCGSCGRIGGCSPELIGDCWLFGLGKIFRQGEYFAGAQAFQAAAFQVPQLQDRLGDCSFGFYAGTNVGIPLCRLTCGLVSGQIGVRTVQSDYSGDLFASDNRDQLFVTTGLYRRVDYGLQFGVVMDYLRENWFTQVDLIQLRGDLAWVYPSGHAFGFRFAENVQDDLTDGILNGARFFDMQTSTYDQYRFYFRNGCVNGGWSDFFLGWTDEQHVIGGMEYDIPVSECWALQSGFTYFFPQDTPQAGALAGNSNDAWNVFVGLTWRPQGRCWYRNYDQPILPVADNGSMVLRRRF